MTRKSREAEEDRQADQAQAAHTTPNHRVTVIDADEYEAALADPKVRRILDRAKTAFDKSTRIGV